MTCQRCLLQLSQIDMRCCTENRFYSVLQPYGNTVHWYFVCYSHKMYTLVKPINHCHKKAKQFGFLSIRNFPRMWLSVRTLFRWGGKILYHFATNVLKTIYTKFYQNLLCFVENMTKTFVACFYRFTLYVWYWVWHRHSFKKIKIYLHTKFQLDISIRARGTTENNHLPQWNFASSFYRATQLC